MHINKKILCFVFVVFCSFWVFSFESAGNLLDNFQADGAFIEQFSQADPEFMKPESLVRQRCEEALNSDDTWTCALFCFIPYPDEMMGMSDEQKLVFTYNAMNKVSTQKGITYISHAAGEKPAVLFTDAYMISNPAKKNSKIPDPVIKGPVPKTETKYSFQKDNRFGNNIYKLDYFTSEDEIFLDLTNCNAMKYMGFTCLEKESLSLCVDACLFKEGILVSGLATVTGQERQVKALLLTVDLPSAFVKRLTSLAQWFENSISGNV